MKHLNLFKRLFLIPLMMLAAHSVNAQHELSFSDVQPEYDHNLPGAVFGYTRVAINDDYFVGIAADYVNQLLDVYQYDEETDTWNLYFRRIMEHNDSWNEEPGLDSDVAMDDQTIVVTKLIEYGPSCTSVDNCPRYAVIEVFEEMEDSWSKTDYLSPHELPADIKSQLEKEVGRANEDQYGFGFAAGYNLAFGRHLAVDGDYIAVGARTKNSPCGAVVIYERGESGWEFLQLIRQDEIDPGQACTEFGYWFDFLPSGDLHIPSEDKNYIFSLSDGEWELIQDYDEADYTGVDQIHVADDVVAMTVNGVGTAFYNRMGDGTLVAQNTLSDFYINKFDAFNGTVAASWYYDGPPIYGVDTIYFSLAQRMEDGMWVIADTFEYFPSGFDFADLSKINRIALSEKRIYISYWNTFLGSYPYVLNMNMMEEEEFISESNMNGSFSVFPNPADDHLRIFSDVEIATYELYDVQGRILTMGVVNAPNFDISTTEIPNGMYVLKLTEKDGMIHSKNVLIRHP